ncbi:helix-turn-helix domain-containing protein [Microbacterium aurum]
MRYENRSAARSTRWWSQAGSFEASASQEKHLGTLHQSGTHTTSEIAELLGVARSTVYRALQRGGNALSS